MWAWSGGGAVLIKNSTQIHIYPFPDHISDWNWAICASLCSSSAALIRSLCTSSFRSVFSSSRFLYLSLSSISFCLLMSRERFAATLFLILRSQYFSSLEDCVTNFLSAFFAIGRGLYTYREFLRLRTGVFPGSGPIASPCSCRVIPTDLHHWIIAFVAVGCEVLSKGWSAGGLMFKGREETLDKIIELRTVLTSAAVFDGEACVPTASSLQLVVATGITAPFAGWLVASSQDLGTSRLSWAFWLFAADKNSSRSI